MFLFRVELLNIDQVIRSLAFIGRVETGREGILRQGGGRGWGVTQGGGKRRGDQSDALQVEGSWEQGGELNEVTISAPIGYFQGSKSKLKE